MKERFNPGHGEHYYSGHEVTLRIHKQLLQDYFKGHTTVRDIEKGYLFAPWVNLEIDPFLLRITAEQIANHFKDDGISHVAGIPTLGGPLGAVVAEQLGVSLIVPRKGLVYPASFGSEVVVSESTASFTTGEKNVIVFPSLLRKLDINGHVLLVDDFCALGETGVAIIHALQKLGIKVSYATYVSKDFQGGIDRIQKSGVNAFAAIHVTEIKPNGELILGN